MVIIVLLSKLNDDH